MVGFQSEFIVRINSVFYLVTDENTSSVQTRVRIQQGNISSFLGGID